MTDLPPESHRLDPDHHPTPFSAEQIRIASSNGRRNTFRVEADGVDAHHMCWEFLPGTDATAEFLTWTESIEGERLSEPEVRTASWPELQAHASYPTATTAIESTRITVGAGTFDCWCYESGQSESLTRAWFAKDLPGPPVLHESEVGGVIAYRSELVAVDRSR